jgi:hypothetical protein
MTVSKQALFANSIKPIQRYRHFSVATPTKSRIEIFGKDHHNFGSTLNTVLYTKQFF